MNSSSNRRASILRAVAVNTILLGCLCLASTAMAADPTGSYSIEGTQPDGTTYTGSLEVSQLEGTSFYTFDWNASGAYRGIGLTASAGSYGVVWGFGPESSCTIQVFHLRDGRMEADWLYAADPKATLGHEVATARGGAAVGDDGISGSYDVRGTNPNGTTYAARLDVSPVGDEQYLFEWDLDGERYVGVGFPEEGYVTVVSSLVAEQGSCGQSSFAADAAGNLSGYWWTNDPNTGIGSEVATKQGVLVVGKLRSRYRPPKISKKQKPKKY